MPLDRAHITRASRLVLPLDVLFNVGLGLTWALQSPERTSPALEAIRQHYSPAAIGWVLVCVGVVVLLGMVLRHREIAAIGLAAGIMAYAFLTVLTTSALHPSIGLVGVIVPVIHLGAPNISAAAPFWMVYLAVAHAASLISLAFDEGNPDSMHLRP